MMRVAAPLALALALSACGLQPMYAGGGNGAVARGLAAVEVPAIETYNDGRDAGFKVTLTRVGGTLVLGYQLKPCHNAYRLETRLLSSYPTVPPETRVLTPLKHCPHLLEGKTLCLWRQGSTRAVSRWDPAKFNCVFAIQAAWRWLACYERVFGAHDLPQS